MSWSSAITDWLANRRLSPAYLLESIELAGATPPGGGLALSSLHTRLHDGYERMIDPLSVRLGAESVDLRELIYTGGSWQVALVWRTGAQRSALYDGLTRGAPVLLKWGSAFWDAADYEPLRAGVVSDITEQGNTITVVCWDLLTALRTRITTADWPPLFGSLDPRPTTALSSGYTVGDTTLNVNDTSAFEQDSASGYLLSIASGSFYLTATGSTGTTFTGVSAAGVFGTTAANKSAGTAVQGTAWLNGHPFEIAARMLTSTGAGTNGAEDTCPASWGYGVPVALVDLTNIAAWITALAPASGSDIWDWIATLPDVGGLYNFLAPYVAGAGMWLCNRHGQITGRGLQDLRSSPTTIAGLTITDADIVTELASLEPRDAQQPFEVRYRSYTHSDSGASDNPVVSTASNNLTWPLLKVAEIDLTPVLWANGDAVCNAYLARVAPWGAQVPERLRVRVAGLHYLQLCVGDVISVTSSRLRSFFVSAEGGYSATPMMVVGMQAGLPYPHVDLDLVALPEDAEDARGA